MNQIKMNIQYAYVYASYEISDCSVLRTENKLHQHGMQ